MRDVVCSTRCTIAALLDALDVSPSIKHHTLVNVITHVSLVLANSSVGVNREADVGRPPMLGVLRLQ